LLDSNQSTSLQFANAVLDNIGASIPTGRYAGPDIPGESSSEGTNAALADIMNNPLAIGLEEDIIRVESRSLTIGESTELRENIESSGTIATLINIFTFYP